jgi:hypothetical protein
VAAPVADQQAHADAPTAAPADPAASQPAGEIPEQRPVGAEAEPEQADRAPAAQGVEPASRQAEPTEADKHGPAQGEGTRIAAPSAAKPAGGIEGRSGELTRPLGDVTRRMHNKQVKRQGALGLALLVLLILGVAAGAWYVVTYVLPGETSGTTEYGEEPGGADGGAEAAASGDAGAGGDEAAGTGGSEDTARAAAPVEVSPTVLVIDAGASMREVFGYAILMAQHRARQLGSDRDLAVLVAREEGVLSLSEGYMSAGTSGAEKIDAGTEALYAGGATTARVTEALLKAIAMEPAAVVLYSAKEVDAGEVISVAKERGVRVDAYALTRSAAARKSLKALAEATGGNYAAHSAGELDRLVDQWDL